MTNANLTLHTSQIGAGSPGSTAKKPPPWQPVPLQQFGPTRPILAEFQELHPTGYGYILTARSSR